MASLHVLILAGLCFGIDAMVISPDSWTINHQVPFLRAGLFDVSLEQHTFGRYRDEIGDLTDDSFSSNIRSNNSGTDISAFPVYIESTDTPAGKQRRRSLLKQCRVHKLHCMLLPFPGSRFKEVELSVLSMAMLRMFRDSPHEAAILTQDDVIFIPNFREELQKTLEDVPNQDDMDLMHLCPGALWGRAKNKPDNMFTLRPFRPVVNDKPSVNGRIFLEYPKLDACCDNKRGVVPGAPVSVFMKKRGAEQALLAFEQESGFTLEDFFSMKMYSRSEWLFTSDDQVFQRLALQHTGRHWVAREPQLCKELGAYIP